MPKTCLGQTKYRDIADIKNQIYMNSNTKKAQALSQYIAGALYRLADGKLRVTETELHLAHGYISRV